MRRLFLVTLTLLIAAPAAVGAKADDPLQRTNPIAPHWVDPRGLLHRDGYYYFTATVPEYDRVELRRARTLGGLSNASAKVIWRRHESGPMSKHLWAPEIHFLDGKWYVYGNLLLSVPLRGDGTMDEGDRQMLESVAAWMAVISECIFGTRPLRVYGEGPSTTERLEITRFGAAAEARMEKPLTRRKISVSLRKLRVRWLSRSAADREIKSVRLVGVSATLKWSQTVDALEIELPAPKPCDRAYALKIE